MAKIQMVPMIVDGAQKTPRKLRQPFNPFYCAAKAMQIFPFLSHPVLAGESLASVKFEARVVTDPLVAPLVGGAMEFYLFYVKLTDLVAIDDAAKAMITSPLTPYVNASGANVAWYHNGSGINWTKLCYDRIIETYFRTEMESAATAVVGDYALASIRLPHTGPFSSIAEAANVAGLADLGDQTTSEALDIALESYDQLKDNGLVNMSFEDYLRMVGVRVSHEQDREPQQLWSRRQWSYPVNTVEATTGVPSTALSWVFDETAKSRTMFKEWGFLIGLACFRPKFYRKNQTGAITHFFDRGVSWMPSVLNPNPATSIRIFLDGTPDGPLGGTQAANYAMDMNDALHYGDQFTNLDVAGVVSGRNMATLPTDAMEARFPSSADIDAVFSGANKTVRVDGYCKPAILSPIGADATGQNLAIMGMPA